MGYKYSGYVYDADTKDPIDGAIVRHTCACNNKPGSNETTTINGFYELTLSHADAENHHITAIAEGYEPQTHIPDCKGKINYMPVGQDFHLKKLQGPIYAPVF